MATTPPSAQCLRLLRSCIQTERLVRCNCDISQIAATNAKTSFKTAQRAPTSRKVHPLRPHTHRHAFTTQCRRSQPQIPEQSQPTTPITNSAAVDAPPPPTSGGPSTAEMQRQIQSGLSPPRAATLGETLAKGLRSRAKGATETYITYGLTQSLFNVCSAQAAYTIPEDQRTGLLSGKGPTKTAGGEDVGFPEAIDGEASSFWFGELGLNPTFSTWSQVACLHMYLLTVRLRAMDDPAQFLNYQRYLLEHYSHAAEDKMLLLHGMSARGIRNRYLKDLFLQWRGLLAAYDEGLVKGDAVLGAAVWRNMWKGGEEVDWTKVAVVVAYMRRVVGILGNVEVGELVQSIGGSDGVFEVAREDLMRQVVKKSIGMDEPFAAVD